MEQSTYLCSQSPKQLFVNFKLVPHSNFESFTSFNFRGAKSDKPISVEPPICGNPNRDIIVASENPRKGELPSDTLKSRDPRSSKITLSGLQVFNPWSQSGFHVASKLPLIGHQMVTKWFLIQQQ